GCRGYWKSAWRDSHRTSVRGRQTLPATIACAEGRRSTSAARRTGGRNQSLPAAWLGWHHCLRRIAWLLWRGSVPAYPEQAQLAPNRSAKAYKKAQPEPAAQTSASRRQGTGALALPSCA